ncbi:MAG: hypothetical protein RL104_767, partial [Bacteroidota bacterium]
MPVPKAPPPGARVQPAKPKPAPMAPQPATDSRAVNDVLPFLAFVEKHPVGSKVKCLVDSYSAHGAYVSVDDIKAYAPLRLLGSPPPRSARDALKLGQVVQLVIAGYTPSRRSVEVGVVEAVKVAVPVKAGETVRTETIDLVALSTRPPARYTEATLLSAMEGAGKLIDDDELRAAMAEKGLGTPATRASIIEGLIAENYLIRDGKELIPTTKAFQLFTLLRGLGVSELTAPELTGEWEHKLAEMERGRLARDDFMREIAQMTRQIVERAKNYQADTVPGDYAALKTACPKCGAQVQENYRRYACTACDFSISKIPGARQLEVGEAEQLIAQRQIGPLQGFRSKMGRPFAAILKLTDDHRLEFDFGQSTREDETDGEAVDFSGQTALGACPKCSSR